MKVFGIKIKLMAASDEVDVVLNQSNTHRESSKAKPAKAKWKKTERNGQTRKYTS